MRQILEIRLLLCVFSLLLFHSNDLFGQKLIQSIIASSGDFQSDDDSNNLHFTIGEVVVDNHQNDVILSQGFHQLFFIEVDVEYVQPADYALNVFPNPTMNKLELFTESRLKFDAFLMDEIGRKVIEVEEVMDGAEINVSHLNKGLYFFSISYENKIVKTFKITKH